MATVTTQLERAKSSRIANQLSKQEFKSIEKIIVGERPAMITEGWFEVNCSIQKLDEIGAKTIYLKTATLYGRSRLYVRLSEGINVQFVLENFLDEPALVELEYSNNQDNISDNEDYMAIRLVHNKYINEFYVIVNCGRNYDNDIYVFDWSSNRNIKATKQAAYEFYKSLVANAEIEA